MGIQISCTKFLGLPDNYITVLLCAQHFICDLLNKIRGSHSSFADNSGLCLCDALLLVPNASVELSSRGVFNSYIR